MRFGWGRLHDHKAGHAKLFNQMCGRDLGHHFAGQLEVPSPVELEGMGQGLLQLCGGGGAEGRFWCGHGRR